MKQSFRLVAFLSVAVAVLSPSTYGANRASSEPGVGVNSTAGWLDPTAGQCISAEAKKTLTACPEGVDYKRGRRKGSLSSVIETESNESSKKPNIPQKIDIPRPLPELTKKVLSLLTAEIGQLEGQFRPMKPMNPKHPIFAYRLAGAYYELEHIQQSDVLDLTTKLLEAEKSKAPNVSELRAKKEKAERFRDLAQSRLIELYNIIIEKHGLNYPKIDEVLYYLAYEYEQQKAIDLTDKAQVRKEREAREKALNTYLKLIKMVPNSKFAPTAYVAYGDLYFEEALNGKISWNIPLEAYDRVIKASDPPENKHWGYAQYKKGFIYWNLGQYKDAVDAFKSAIDFGSKYPDIPKAPQIADEARKELVPVYAEYGKAEDAEFFFRSLSTDNTQTIKLLEKLGEEYLARARPMEAKKLFIILKGLHRINSCYYDTRIAEAVMVVNPKDKAAIRTQLSILAKDFAKYRDSGAPQEMKLSCGNQTAWLLIEHAIAWEYEALGDLGCPPDEDRKKANPQGRAGTCNKDTIASSLQLFKAILSNFKNFDGYKFKVKRPEDTPTIFKLKYSYADLLYGQQMWAECAQAFDEVVREDPNGEVAADAAFAALICTEKLYEQQYGNNKDKVGQSSDKNSLGISGESASLAKQNTPKELNQFQSRMVSAFNQFACYIQPDSSSKTYKEDLEKLIQVKHRRGYVYYDAKHWDEAAEAFREIAFTYPEHEYGIIDAGLYFDALVRIYKYANPKREKCGTAMSDDVDKLIELYCDKEKVTTRLGDAKKAEEFLGANSGQCDKLTGAKTDLDALKAQDEVSNKNYEKAAEIFSHLYERACANRSSACEERGDVYLYNAALNYQRASRIKTAMDIRKDKILTHDSWKSKETYRLTMFDLAEDYRRIAVYKSAAEYFERFANADPNVTSLLELAGDKVDQLIKDQPDKYSTMARKDVAIQYSEEQRASALSNAVILRLGLGQEEEAIKNSEFFEKRFGAKRQEQARRIFLAIGEHYVEKREWKKGADRLEKFFKVFTNARLDESFHARALLGRAYAAMKDLNKAEKTFGEIRGEWAKNRADVRKELEKSAKENTPNSKILQNAYSAVAEAYLFFADRDADKAQKINFEPYRGNGEMTDTDRYFKSKFAPYLEKRIKANEPAYHAYQRVLCMGEDYKPDVCTVEWKELGRTFAAKFVVEAASKAGDLYADTYDKARNAPLSNDLTIRDNDSASIKKEKLALRSLYFSVFDKTAEPIKVPARSAFQECLTLSTEARFFDEYSERCEKWLAKVYKTEFRTLEELRPPVGLVNSGLRDRVFLVDKELVPFDLSLQKESKQND